MNLYYDMYKNLHDLFRKREIDYLFNGIELLDINENDK